MAFRVIFSSILLILCNLAIANCHPIPNFSLPQYLIGYGSLIQAQSKNETYPNTGPNIPVQVTGYERGWFARGKPMGFNASATFLGIIPKSGTKFNGIIFNVPNTKMLMAFDQREMVYCRVAVAANQIKPLSSQKLPKGQYWIYLSQTDSIAKPNNQFPILQSYVDIFLSGCLEIQQQYQLPNYAKQCVLSTAGWAPFWVNDRIFPRRPWQYQPKAKQIDGLLMQQMPHIFQQIRIE